MSFESNFFKYKLINGDDQLQVVKTGKNKSLNKLNLEIDLFLDKIYKISERAVNIN
jgi:hypothetical protein